MSSPFGPLTLIANPKAGRGSVGAKLPGVEQALRERELEYEAHVTEGPGDATRLARRAVESGRRFIVAVGGDGTVHEVLNGLLRADVPVQPGTVLGVISAGSGCDFIRTFGLPADALGAVGRFAGDETRPLDVGKVSYLDREGRPMVRYFANIAEAGLGGSTARRAARLPARLGPARYFLAFWLVLPSYRPRSACLEKDGEPVFEGRAVNVVLANGRFFGGGMHVSPASDPADGALDVQVYIGPKSDSFTMLPKVYAGRHLPHRNVVELKGARFRLHGEHALEIEADGEVLGTTPATIEVLARLIELKV
ncbi:MAG: diacylglycerol kinase family lipid kinase [Actinomycetota bacterium]|nr:diacylglycerol kinase family lipid kinase [Actinomycetota bacterium]